MGHPPAPNIALAAHEFGLSPVTVWLRAASFLLKIYSLSSNVNDAELMQ